MKNIKYFFVCFSENMSCTSSFTQNFMFKLLAFPSAMISKNRNLSNPIHANIAQEDNIYL